jgi:nucleoside-diphosphate-sugar epimerase
MFGEDMDEIKNILVTGSSGTIGTALCEALLQQGFRVTGADLKHNRWNKALDQVTVICDLRDKSFFSRLPPDLHLIVHLAANARVYYTVQQPQLTRDNFEMTFNILEFARQNQVPGFIYASSREIYGNSNRFPHGEDDFPTPEHCESPYAASKIGAEAMTFAFSRCYGIESVVLRFSNVYGKYDESDRVVPHFIRLASQGSEMEVFGKDKVLDFTYISDCIDGILRSIRYFTQARGHIFNIASGKGATLLEVAELIAAKYNTNRKIAIRQNRTGEVIKYVADISRARELLHFDPRISIEEGLEKTVRWYQENRQYFL